MGEPSDILKDREVSVPLSARERAEKSKPNPYIGKIKGVFEDIRTKGYSQIQPFSVGRVEDRMRDYASTHSVDMANGGLYMSYSSIAHATRQGKKDDGVSVSEQELIDFPARRLGMDLYYDKNAKLFIYVDEPNKAKFVVHPSYSLQIKRTRTRKVNFITASRIKSTENFQKDRVRYDKI